jgi:hypothetical protein
MLSDAEAGEYAGRAICRECGDDLEDDLAAAGIEWCPACARYDRHGATNSDGKPICGAPAHYGGLSATRKYASTDLGYQGTCNQVVKAIGDRCWRHGERR